MPYPRLITASMLLQGGGRYNCTRSTPLLSDHQLLTDDCLPRQERCKCTHQKITLKGKVLLSTTSMLKASIKLSPCPNIECSLKLTRHLSPSFRLNSLTTIHMTIEIIHSVKIQIYANPEVQQLAHKSRILIKLQHRYYKTLHPSKSANLFASLHLIVLTVPYFLRN
jgi:hypothetical protein